LLAERNLIVSFDEEQEGEIPTLRPIPLSPALLIGLDKQTRDNFLALWRSSLGAAIR